MLHAAHLLREGIAAQAARLRRGLADLAEALVLLLVAGLVTLAGIVFLLVGVYQSLSATMPAWQAGTMVAVAAAAVALLLLLWSRLRLRGPRAIVRAEPPESAAADEMRRAVEQGVQAGESLRRSGMNVTDLALAAFVAGLVVSRSTRSGRDRDRGRSRDPGDAGPGA